MGQYGTLIDRQQIENVYVGRSILTNEEFMLFFNNYSNTRPYWNPPDILLNDELNSPTGICIHGDRIYVADTLYNRIIVLTTDLQYVGQINNSTLKRKTRTLFRPTRVCVSNDN
jgi:hypothetical protein